VPLLCLALSVTAPAWAQNVSPGDKETARRLMDEGDTAFAAKDLGVALKKYQGADAIMGVPTTAVEVGKTLEAMGKLVEARDAYLRVVRFPLDKPNKAFESAKLSADEHAQALTARIATLQLRISGIDDGTELQVSIDGNPVSAAGLGQRSVNPGDHRIVVTAPGYLEASEQVTLGEGETKPLAITLKKDADTVVAPVPSPVPSKPAATAPPPSVDPHEGGFPVWATVGFSVGAVGIGVGAAFGILSLQKAGDLDEACPDQTCPAGGGLEKTQDDSLLFANISNVGFAVGGAGVVFGVIALFTLDASDDDSETGIRIDPIVGPGYAGVRGSF
jgi:PEGA domain